MQDVVGWIVLGLVCVASLIASISVSKSHPYQESIVTIAVNFVIFVIACYLFLGVCLGFVWVIAWIGTVIREGIMWFIEAVLKPFAWIWPR